MTRIQNAEAIALRSIVFARHSHEHGMPRRVTRDLIMDMATELGIGGNEYSIRTVKAILNREAAAMGETNLLGYLREKQEES